MRRNKPEQRSSSKLFFKHFREERRSRSTLGDVFQRLIPVYIVVDIERTFEEEEITDAIKECSNFKAPA